MLSDTFIPNIIYHIIKHYLVKSPQIITSHQIIKYIWKLQIRILKLKRNIRNHLESHFHLNYEVNLHLNQQSDLL